MDLGVVTRVAVGDHFELGTAGLQGDQKEHSLGVQRGVDVTTLTCRSHSIEHPEGGVIQISLGRHAVISRDQRS
jgi:hypothetical protein